MACFSCLYYFSSPELDLIEIRRTDLPEKVPLSEIYKWLVLSSKSGKVFELDFKSMNKIDLEETRTFIEGDLKFNSEEGNLNLLGKSYRLQRKNQDDLPSERNEHVRNYLAGSPSQYELCGFRPLRPSDVTYFLKWIFDKEVIRYSMTKFHRISDEGQVVDWFHATLFDPNSVQLGLFDPESKELIGYAGIAGINEIDGNGEYFIFIGNKSFWGRGIGSFVTKEIVKMGFLKMNLHRIYLTASSLNSGAIRAYEKAGFIQEGRMREAFYRNKTYSDKVIMGILRSEFETL